MYDLIEAIFSARLTGLENPQRHLSLISLALYQSFISNGICSMVLCMCWSSIWGLRGCFVVLPCADEGGGSERCSRRVPRNPESASAWCGGGGGVDAASKRQRTSSKSLTDAASRTVPPSLLRFLTSRPPSPKYQSQITCTFSRFFFFPPVEENHSLGLSFALSHRMSLHSQPLDGGGGRRNGENPIEPFSILTSNFLTIEIMCRFIFILNF